MPHLAFSIDKVYNHPEEREAVTRRPYVEAEMTKSERCAKKLRNNPLEVVEGSIDPPVNSSYRRQLGREEWIAED